MLVEGMIAAMVEAFKSKLAAACGDAVEQDLTPQTAEAVARGVNQALAAAGAAGYRAFLEAKETAADAVVRDGETYRYTYDSHKDFLSLWGPMTVRRRIYQNAADGPCYVPLDAAWGMQGQYLTVEVREAVAFAAAHVTPEETAQLLEKCALFHPHATQIKRALEGIGDAVAPEREALDARIRAGEQAPEETLVVCASLDGVNTLMRAPGGAKQGRPAERPGAGQAQAASTAYQNAMVGCISFYGAVPQQEHTPQRLGCRYVSHMPEAQAPTFKARFEAELDAAEAQVPAGTIKVLLCDAARPLWTYAEEAGRYADYEWLVDFHHTAEHLSLAAEALFGKGAAQATRWYEQYRQKLLECDDGAQRVLRSLAYFEKHRSRSKAQREALRAQRTFFVRNQDRMTYAAFRRRGLPIGSGPVEAACKTRVKQRLCRSGMRWSPEGGGRILDLRTYVKSNRWDAFWTEYKNLQYAA